MFPRVKLGIDILLSQRRDLIEGCRIGILANAASIGSGGKNAIVQLCSDKAWRVTAIFGPEHGVQTMAEDMEPVVTSMDPTTGIPIYSLYGKNMDSLRPTAEMLKDIDVLVVDLQDVGSRYYTYIWTAVLCMEACRASGKKIVVCDRPNPIGGALIEGPAIEPGLSSFVGLHSLPVRHAMTIGEIVQLVNDREKIGADITVVRTDGWSRGMDWPDTGLIWHNPSPNMRSYEAALLYPGMCLIEGTNLSEGRGTPSPFEIVGAPFIKSKELCDEFNTLGLSGIFAEPVSFLPTHQKWTGRQCSGVRWKITDAKSFRPYLAGLAFIWLINRTYRGHGFEWRTMPYEFVTDKPAIDLLTGSVYFRENIDGLSLDKIAESTQTPQHLIDERARHLLY